MLEGHLIVFIVWEAKYKPLIDWKGKVILYKFRGKIKILISLEKFLLYLIQMN